MLTSVDGKISTGHVDDRDFDKDLPNVSGIAEGLEQYYSLEQETDLYSLNSGRVMAKVGWNDEKDEIVKLPVTFVIVDNKPHLTTTGVANLLLRAKKLIIATTNVGHPAKAMSSLDLKVIEYDQKIDFDDLFKHLKSDEGADRLTIQSGGELNSELIRAGLINYLSIVVAPIIVGGRQTPTLVDGETLVSVQDLEQLKPLELVEAKPLDNSYLHLKYIVL